MGSSAAFSVAMSASLLKAFEMSMDEVSHFADYMEKLIHGKPSGCDVQIVLKGGCIQFIREPLEVKKKEIKP